MPPLPSPQQVAKALAEIIGDALSQGQVVEVEGLGRFRRRHEAGRLVPHGDSTVIQPPSDRVRFEPHRDR